MEEWTTEDLGPIGGQPFDMLGVPRMGEGVVEHWIIQTALVVRGGEPQERLLSAGGLEDGHALPVTVGHCRAPFGGGRAVDAGHLGAQKVPSGVGEPQGVLHQTPPLASG